jgi:hypothetical protein
MKAADRRAAGRASSSPSSACRSTEIPISASSCGRQPASQRLIQAIAAKWDWRLCTPLLVASRDGGLYIIDGQHRWEAAKLRGDIPFLPCAVGNYTGSAEEAALFVAANRHRVRVNPLDMWRAAIAAGDEATVTIERLVAGAACRSPHAAPGTSCSPASCCAPRRSIPRSDPRRRQARGLALVAIGTAFATR